jgi:3-hydroxyacyl-CoA dehydrogenase
MTREKRKHTRLALHSKANIQLGDQNIEAESENLSLNGAFVAAISPIVLNDVVAFTFSDIPISAKAKVVRVTDKGIGLQFENTLLD